MAEPLSPKTVIETLRSVGISEAEIEFRQLDHGWRIRAQGGLVVQMRQSGELVISGKNTHAVRRALGLTGRGKLKPPA
ncbi:MAG: hypothetical protein ACR652_15035 [Methylocystis sp.]|uniref:hypothetical protein n=1 Tax=Methylocystis sp. TaxID=1911079 RepID=UPI003DA56C7C